MLERKEVFLFLRSTLLKSENRPTWRVGGCLSNAGRRGEVRDFNGSAQSEAETCLIVSMFLYKLQKKIFAFNMPENKLSQSLLNSETLKWELRAAVGSVCFSNPPLGERLFLDQ